MACGFGHPSLRRDLKDARSGYPFSVKALNVELRMGFRISPSLSDAALTTADAFISLPIPLCSSQFGFKRLWYV